VEGTWIAFCLSSDDSTKAQNTWIDQKRGEGRKEQPSVMERGSPQYACALATLTKRGDGKGTDEQNHLDLGGGKARKGGARATESVGFLRERFSL